MFLVRAHCILYAHIARCIRALYVVCVHICYTTREKYVMYAPMHIVCALCILYARVVCCMCACIRKPNRSRAWQSKAKEKAARMRPVTSLQKRRCVKKASFIPKASHTYISSLCIAFFTAMLVYSIKITIVWHHLHTISELWSRPHSSNTKCLGIILLMASFLRDRQANVNLNRD